MNFLSNVENVHITLYFRFSVSNFSCVYFSFIQFFETEGKSEKESSKKKEVRLTKEKKITDFYYINGLLKKKIILFDSV